MTGGRVLARGHGASLLVAALSSGFGVVLLLATGVMSTYIGGSDLARHAAVQVDLMLVAVVFIAISVYVGSIVTTNTFATIVAGRTRSLALMRLIGSSSAALRRSVAREGLAVGVLGSVMGLLGGEIVVIVGVRILVASGVIPDREYPLVAAWVLLPTVAVVLTTWLASWVGSRRVLTVTPLQAAASSVDISHDEATRRVGRNVTAIALFGLGIALLMAGIVIGMVSPLGVLVSMLGGILSFTGLVLGAHLLMPPVLAAVGLVLGRSAPARLAVANATRYPERSSRTSIGLVIGVTLVTMFAVGAQSFQNAIQSAVQAQPGVYASSGIDTIVSTIVTVFSVLIGFSAIIAAVGMVNNLSLGVMQRRRELGLLRALGFSSFQVRMLMLAESAQLVVAAVVTGLVLGVFYGWAGAQALLGSLPGGGLVAPALPWPILVLAVVLCAVLAVAASIAPTRMAVRTSPMAALAVE